MAYDGGNGKEGRYFLKDKKARIYEFHAAGTGYYAEKWYRPTTPDDLWCYARQLTQEQMFAAAAYWDKETRFFVFNFNVHIETFFLILYRGLWYEVTRVDTTEDYNTDIFVYAKLLYKPEHLLEYGEEWPAEKG